MYDHSEYEAEIREDLTLETRLRRTDEPAPAIRIMVVGPNVEEVSTVAKTLVAMLKRRQDGQVVKPKG